MPTPKEGQPQPSAPLVTSIDLSDILSLTDFQRSAKQHIHTLRKSGKPQVLTVNGAAALVVQDARSYQRLLDEIAMLKDTLATRTALVAARVEEPAQPSRLPRVPPRATTAPKPIAPAADEPQTTPATDGLARALAQLRQQLSATKGEPTQAASRGPDASFSPGGKGV
jgi:hypothetical protein